MLYSDKNSAEFLQVGGLTQFVGAVAAYESIDGNWVQMGDFLLGTEGGQEFGSAIAINKVGDRIIVGVPNNDGLRGAAFVYEFVNGAWQELGQAITEPTAFESPLPPFITFAGAAVAISADGNRIALSSPFDTTDANGPLINGSITVYEYNSATKLWEQLGNQLMGADEAEGAGFKMTFNAAGDRLVASFNADVQDSTDFLLFALKVFELRGNVWEQLGTDIPLPEGIDPTNENFDIDMSDSGDTVAFGTNFTEDFTDARGIAAVYALNGSEWEQVDGPILGEDNFSGLGLDISLSGNGSFLAVSDRLDFSNETLGYRGRVTTYLINTTLSIAQNEIGNITYYPNPTKDHLNIDFVSDQERVDVSIYNVIGEKVFSKTYRNTRQIELSHDLSTGLYVLNLEQGEDQTSYKLIVD